MQSVPSTRSNRQWLRMLVTGAVALAMIGTAQAQQESAAIKPKPKVLVLGAGMSGVMAANTLFEKGIKDITIIEANDYIGGRMKAGAIGGRKIELGANWIHGAGPGNPIYDFAVKENLNLVQTNWSHRVYLPLGDDPNEEEEVEKFDKAFEKTEERAKRYRATGKKDLNVADALRYEGWVARTPLEKALLFDSMDGDMGPAEATSFELALNIATNDKYDDDLLVIDAKGYNSLARDLLAKNFPNPLSNKNVVLGTKVDKIIYTDKGVTVLATSNGKTVAYNADFVITTFSAGVLRNKALDLFVPTLPEDKMDAIFRVDMTLFGKVFVETTEKFWADVTDGAESWLFADDVKGNFTSWLDLSLPKLGANYAIPKNGTYLSMSMIAGDFVVKMEKLSNDQLKDEVIKAMRAMFPKVADRITTKTVTSVVMNKWGQDDLFSGSWSNPGRDFTVDDFAKLGEPVGRVYFSGEHTSAQYFGYVHGAYTAGVNTANQLLKRPEFA